MRSLSLCSIPTLVLLECVLVYMEPHQAAELLRWAAAALPTAAVLIYDPTRPHDAFGQQMLLNLAARGCPLVGIAGGAEPAAHAARLRSAGWARAAAADMDEVYRRFLEPGPRAAAERREMLDEIEEWTLIQRHYALALGVNDAAVRPSAHTPPGCGSERDACVTQGVLGSLSLEPAAAFDS
jgi:tRNA wybutosine-synthesizing protein 4